MGSPLYLLLLLINGVLGTAPRVTREVLRSCPEAEGPYSEGIRVANTTYTTGRTGGHPFLGVLVPGGIVPETRQALNTIAVFLTSIRLTLDSVVKVTVFLYDMNDYEAMNGVYSETFKDNYPARSVVQAKYIPEGSHLMVEAIAVGEKTEPMRILSSASQPLFSVRVML